ncbi:MAG: T9SS type A sorting domain-containing protein [Bacteroidales bacterium]|nr:T9SS type A sorting domain-containing protein [Bacteroidales bacterium]
MKNSACFLLLLLLFFIAKPSYSQDFWEVVPTPDTTHPRSITINSNGDIFIGNVGVYLSQDTGETWQFKGLHGKIIFSIAIDSVGNIFAGSSGKLYKSIDYGDSWELILTDVQNVISLAICNNGLMFAGMPFYVFRSFDYGNSWDTSYVFSGLWEYANDFEVTLDNTIFLGTTAWMGNGGGVYCSVDNGDTWQHIGLLDHYVQALSINSSGNLFAAVFGHHYTGIGGCYVYDEINSDWLFLTDNLNADAIVTNSNDDIYLGVSNEAGGPGGVYHSLDGGETWQWINSGLSFNSIIELYISPDEYIYALTYASHTLHRSINPTVSVISHKAIDIEVDLFPNPFVESLYFKINSSVKSNNCSLVVFDIKGALLKKMEFTDPGNAQILTIDGSDWIPGIYFYRVIIGDYSQSGKIIKLN